MATTTAPQPSTRPRRAQRRWRMPWATAGIGLIALIGVLITLYPTTASWLSQYNQSKAIGVVDHIVDQGPPSRLEKELARAHAYNAALVGGALLSPASNVPTSEGAASGDMNYYDLLNATDDGIMGRLRIPAITVDLPIYHGTSDETLAKGVGHLEGTSLPVGGESQHSVLTAHRGLPSATLFNDLHKLEKGDRFTVEVFGDVLTYEVIETQTVLPDETQSLFPRYDEDLVTLVTCTPLGINTHRYLVTGKRVTPTPIEDLNKAGATPEIPGFPWWTLGLGAALVSYGVLIGISGRAHARNPRPVRERP